MSEDLPFQSHSSTSIEAAERVDPLRERTQEQWIYESLRRGSKADWELWNEVRIERPGLFDKHTSAGRARILLMWVTEEAGGTPWHPVEDSGRKVVNPETNRKTTIWRIKERYQNMPYIEWAMNYRQLARGKRTEDLYYPLWEGFP
jgi:hypothetical protein